MKTNAPERLYLSKNIYSTYLYQVPDPDDETAVEYIRKDAFIEKACVWLKNNLQGIVGGSIYIEDFENYMKGE